MEMFNQQLRKLLELLLFFGPLVYFLVISVLIKSLIEK